ncbi:hypothetical protein HBI88_017170 [Parastagonospora nodorum]|nr:hypothetical protein HBI97_133780 [Parastagonospora nodorum]KAH5802234.1 hypothetical protein HBI96_139340 [Parastagonospora nodorum]KAH5817987.1 hypothetical protein HBI94_116560 [Parastagonospora nodorum]KAH5831189.1 hypothetical protein HBI93_121760 [Parastagonospora nodorum]KAH5859941.1 hypothetical protein HBI91_135180 [Parastagonospora nodorum]
MSGELQTIPARHGVATFVPRGRTIKVINTYGKQVVSMWAFSLGAPPEEGEGEGEAEDIDEDKVREEAEGLKNAVEGKDGGMESGEKDEKIEKKDREEDSRSGTESTANEADKTKPDDDDPPEQAPDTPENEKTTETTASSSKQPTKRTWGSYLPSIPYRNKGAPKKEEGEKKPSAQDEKTQNEANTKKWSSYLPTGKGFSSYVPNVQIPDSKSAISAFQSSHNRDPNKSYAEQLYDFSKTPVGAGTIAAATGSGYASSVYAAYSAYASTHPSNSSQPPMEYLSLPHTRASSHKLVPEVDDILLTNLRNPIITLVEDTTPGAHDTLTAACDANLYSALGTDKPEEHGSCAENLVLALKELNEGAGLKGAKAIGADITVNIAPTPLHLFMNAPLDVANISSIDGAGAKGAILSVDEPKGKKRSYVRFRADRDVVVVFSACPMDVGKQNGGRCMAANFMVEDVKEGEDLASSVASLNNTGKKGTPKQSSSEKHVEKKPEIDVKGEEQKQDIEQDFEQPKTDAETKDTTQEKTTPQDSKPTKKSLPKKLERKPSEKPAEKQPAQVDSTKSDESKPKKKPKKLQVRSSATPAPA